MHNLNRVFLNKKKKCIFCDAEALASLASIRNFPETAECPRNHRLIELQSIITLEQHLEPNK